MLLNRSHFSALLALLLLVPVASIGVAIALYIIPGTIGQTVFSVTKVWLLALPLVWWFWVEQGKFVWQLPQRRELLTGSLLGLLMFGVIFGAYWLIGQHLINPIDVQTKAQQVGIISSNVYLGGAIYFTLINSLLEEFIWRWFVQSKCEVLIPGKISVLLCALLFTLHHILALAAYTNWPIVILGSVGVFVAGVCWSSCYRNYRSIWSSYISHILADLAIAIVGWQILFS
ncbi:MAG: CPBP family intramembrane metalloprotease [Symploca sp. SIO2G7]|nr:CPBP family intramembrane metalloprotease [Symploca sp. SIO2G7]